MKRQTSFTIRELSQKFNLAPSTLRYYETIGLLDPIERKGKHRVYFQADIDRLGAIQCFKQTGMTIKQIQTFFENEKIENNFDCLLTALIKQQDNIEQQINQLNENKKFIKRKINYYQAKQVAYLTHQNEPQWL
ncbi:MULTISPECIES: MerR family transcriptional regulator [unclassified Enterococcus]|uniref:MerR family transcriptional regulator n=1 Tax=unclassified Enterococcus TaxID=2608891 RepID=UPI001551E988|nr:MULTISPECIES: MerR family transcriptional regulator [unclassified Enterococcus]MBS7576814.1 MerR family transcriptional regulator [Enterococcus sp. MMGLQ5-2]MBS7584221.1 MerR family transcriptional regulator [Enterococcus sp. MMGLQ5-1]NPD12077.1 MerR family transcriptional regulator [Enterococcus sp. MMGLQ5-1]NPD36649.1 MerR family transcriptional regulator [Enterococcus sp. MMGLQ5-2]